ncbi:MAG: hypothetical protein LBU61_03905 [Coriobacteriales bacterium]|jgi:ABC-2 type transport system permease protein|nr:hypothetical protein [Coriobacteriales bacterium]
MQGLFSNSLRLVFLMLKRERMVSTIWLIALTLFSVLLAYGMSKGFDDLARSALAITLDNPGIVAMMGPVYGAENYTIGAMYANTMLLWVVIGVSVMNILLVVRHTRSDEERGRLEVVRSLPTGRLAVLNASLITALLINCLLALMIGLGITALRIAGMGLANSMLYGASLGIIGLLFATIAALFSQFSANSNGAIVYSFLALGVFYLLRAAGDINNELASLVSPLGLVLRTQVFVENHWWPIPILVVECLIIMGAAFVFNAQRDIDQGFIPARPGRSKASQWLLSPYGLALRLVRGNFAVWLVVVFLLGASYGSILGDIGTFIAESPLYQQLIGTSDRFSAAMMFTTMVNLIGALVCLVPVLSISLRPLAEEKDGRAEHVLARSV